jgi:hypothetical protein
MERKKMSNPFKILDSAKAFGEAVQKAAKKKDREEKRKNRLNKLGFKKETISEGITCFTLDSKSFR